MGRRTIEFAFDAVCETVRPFESKDARYTVFVEQHGWRATFEGVPSFERNGKAVFELDKAETITLKRY